MSNLSRESNSSTPTIRPITPLDAEQLRLYATRLFAENLPGLYRRPAPSLEDELAFIDAHSSPNSVLLAAEVEGRIIGLAALLGRAHPQEAHVGVVGLSVDREFRGQGLGTLLLESMFEWATPHGITRVEIEAWANNPGAVRLYERSGFVREGIRHNAVEVDGALVDSVCLARWVD